MFGFLEFKGFLMVSASVLKKRATRSGKLEKAPNLDKSRILEGFAVLFFGVSIFLCIAFFSFHPSDPTFNRVPSEIWVVHNSAGIVGSYVAGTIGQVLGSVALILPLAFIFVGVSWIRGRRVESRWRLATGLVVVGIVTAILLQDFEGQIDPLFGSGFPAGGLFGALVAPAIFRFFGTMGGYLVLATVGIFSILQLANLGLSDFLARFSNLICTLLSVFQQCFLAAIRFLGWGIRFCGKNLRRSYNSIKRLAFSLGQLVASFGSELNPLTFPWRTFFGSRQGVKVRAGEIEAESVHDEASSPLRQDPVPVCLDLAVEDRSEISLGEEQAIEEISLDMGVGTNGFDSPRPRLLEEDQPVIEIAAPIETVKRRRRAPHALPGLSLLDDPQPSVDSTDRERLTERSEILVSKLQDFGVEGSVSQVLYGPIVTMFEYAPASGVKVSKIVNLSDDLALGMEAMSVRIVAPIPGKAAVGIEIPNHHREAVNLKEILGSREFQEHTGSLPMALGKDILGRPEITDLVDIPHLLIAGATGSGKSVGLNSMICSLLFRRTPQELRMVMIDPKMLELSLYEGIPHLLTPVVTDPKRASVVLKGLVSEMERRYHLLSDVGVRNIMGYNEKIAEGRQNRRNGLGDEVADEISDPLPHIVVVVDELADLMMVTGKDVEDSIVRLAQMSRAAGIHMIVATQRPSVDVLTGLIKANFPARISFKVSSRTDSRTILDANGGERLLGHGDMLFLPPGTSNLVRIHGAFVSEKEISGVVKFWRKQGNPDYDDSLFSAVSGLVLDEGADEDQYDEKFDEAVELVAKTSQASISMIQRRLRVGYNRAARMIEMMERDGIVGPSDGVKPREVYARAIPKDD